MSALILAALAAGAGLGVLLVVAGLTGRQILDSPSASARRIVGSPMLSRAALAAGAGLVAVAATGWLVGGIMAAVATLVLPGSSAGRPLGNARSTGPKPSRRGPR